MFPHTKPPAGTQINPLHPLSRGLVGCWLFNEGAGSLANDISGNENHGRLKNMAPNVQGSGWGGSKFGGGLEFDGVNDHIDCGNNESVDFGTGDFTISMWMKVKTFRINDMFISKYDGSSVGWYFSLDPTNAPYNKFGFKYGGGIGREILSNSVLTLNTFEHITFVHDADKNDYLYLNDVLDNSQAAFNDNTNATANLRISGFAGGKDIHCSIRSVNIYNQAKSAEEIAWLHREPYAMFEPVFNSALLYPAVPPVGAIMNQFQGVNLGADLYNGAIIA